MRDEIKALTGFDIMKDENTYKSIKEILVGVGKEFQNLTDIQRASLLEMMGGKRASNALAAVLNNYKMVEDAYATAEGAQGSAMREQEAYAQSVQYSIDRAKASFEQLANDFLSSDLLKGLIEFGNGALQFLDGIISKGNSVLSIFTALAGMSAIKGIFGADSIVGGMVSSLTEFKTGDVASKTLVGNIKKILTSSSKKLDIGSFFKSIFLKGASEGISEGLGDKVVSIVPQASMEAAGKSAASGFVSSFLANINPITAGITAAVAGIGIAVAAYTAYRKNIENQKETGVDTWESSKQSLDEYRSQIQSLREELDNTDTSASRQLEIKQELLSIQNEIVAAYGKESAGINLVNGNLNNQLAILDRISQATAKRNLKDNAGGWKDAVKEMTKDVDTFFVADDLTYSPNNEKMLKQLTEQANKIEGLKATMPGKDSFDNEMFRLEINTDDVSVAINQVEKFREQLDVLQEDARWQGDDVLSDNIDVIREHLDTVMSSYEETYANNIKAYKDYLEQLFVSVGGSEYLRNVEEAVDAYNNAARSLDPKALSKAREEVDATGEALQKWYEENGEERGIKQWQIDEYLEEQKVQLDENSAAATDLVEILQESGKIDRSNQFAKNADDIKKYANVVQDLGIDAADTQDALEKLESYKMGHTALETKPAGMPMSDWERMNGIGENEEAIKNLASLFGVTFDGTLEDEARYQVMVSTLTEMGKLLNEEVPEGAEKAGQSISEFATSINNALTSIDAINAALVSSVSGKGLSLEYSEDENGNITWQGDVQNIMNAFGGKEEYKGLYNSATLFRRTASGIKLNTKELRKLQKAQEDITRQKFAEKQTQLQDELTQAYLNLEEARKQGRDTSVLESQISTLQDNIEKVNLLSSAYDGATSAYQKWLDAQSAGEAGDIYDNITSTAIKRGEELKEAGLVGTEEFRALAELFSGQDLTGAGTEEVIAAYDTINKQIGETEYTLKDFFTEGIEGSDKFADAMVKLGYATEEDGFVNFNRINTSELAKSMGTSVDMVEAVLQKMKDFGDEIVWYSDAQSEALDKADQHVEEFKQKHADSGEGWLNLADAVEEADELSEIEDNISTIQNMLNQSEVIGIDSSEVLALEELLDICLEKKKALTGVDTAEGLSTANLESGAKQIAQLTSHMQLWAEHGGIDTNDEQLQQEAEVIASWPEELKTAFGFEADATTLEIIEKLAGDNNWKLKLDVESETDEETKKLLDYNDKPSGMPTSDWNKYNRRHSPTAYEPPYSTTEPYEPPYRTTQPYTPPYKTTKPYEPPYSNPERKYAQEAKQGIDSAVSSVKGLFTTFKDNISHAITGLVTDESPDSLLHHALGVNTPQENVDKLNELIGEVSGISEELPEGPESDQQGIQLSFASAVAQGIIDFFTGGNKPEPAQPTETVEPTPEKTEHEYAQEAKQYVDNVTSGLNNAFQGISDFFGNLGENIDLDEDSQLKNLQEWADKESLGFGGVEDVAEKASRFITEAAENAGETYSEASEKLADNITSSSETASENLYPNQQTPATNPYNGGWAGESQPQGPSLIGQALSIEVEGAELDETEDQIDRIKGSAEEGADLNLNAEVEGKEELETVEQMWEKTPKEEEKVMKLDVQTSQSSPTAYEPPYKTEQPEVQTSTVETKVTFKPDTTEVDAKKAELEAPIIEPIIVDPQDEKIQELTDKVNATKSALDEVDAADPNVDINVNDSQVTAAQPRVDQLAQDRFGSVTLNVQDNGVSSMLSKINSTPTNKTITVTTIAKQVAQLYDGTAHAAGTVSGFYGVAHASGIWGIPHKEHALMGELGEELYVDPANSSWHTVGTNGAEFVDLPKGAIVFNHLQTRDLLEKGYTHGRAHASGTALASTSGRHKIGGYTGSSSSSSSSGSSNTGGNNNSGKSDSSDKKTETASQKFSDWLSSLFNWAEVRLTRLNRLTERWSDRAEKAVRYAYNNITDDDTITRQYKKAADYYVKAINASANEIIGQQKAEKTYTKNLAKIKSKGKLDNKTIKKIKDDTINGTFKLEEYKGASSSSSSSSNSNKKNQKLEAIKAYQDYYEKILACRDAVEDLTESQLDLYDALYNLPIDQANAKIEKLTANMQALQAIASATAGGSTNYFKTVVDNASTLTESARNARDVANQEKASAKEAETKAAARVKTAKKSVKNAKTRNDKKKAKKELKAAKKALTTAKQATNTATGKADAAQLQYERTQSILSTARSNQATYANAPSYVYQNQNLDDQYNYQKQILEERKLEVQTARNNVTAAKARVTANEAVAKAQGKEITQNKKWKKLLSDSQKSTLLSGKTVSTKGIKNKKLLAALKAYNKTVANSTTLNNQVTSSEEKLSQAELDLTNATAESTEMLQENAKAKVDNIISYYENAEKMKDAEYAQLEAQERLNEANGVSQVGDEARLLIEQKIAKQREKNALKQEKYDKAWAEFEKQKATMTEEASAEVEASLKQELNAITDGAVQLKQLEKDLSNLKLTELGMQLEDLATAAEKLQDELDFKTESGAILTADDYERQIDNAEAQKAIIEQENAELEKQIALYDPLSKEGRELQKQLDANNKEYRSLTMSQLKWSKAIAQLPFDALERVKNELQGVNDLLTAQQDLTAEYGIEKSAKDYLDSIQSNVDILQNYMETAALAELKYQQALESADGTYEAKHYTEWKQIANDANKSVLATEKTIVNLRNAMRTLPVDILQKAADLIGTIVSYNQSLDDLKVAMGFELEASDYESQLWDLNEQINSAEALRNQYYEYYQRALTDAENPGYLYNKSAKEWLKLYYDMGTQSNNLQKNWYSLRKELADIPIKELKKYIDELSRLEDQVNSLFDLVSDFTTFNDNGSALTNWGITQFNLTAQAMEKAREQIAEYQTAIEALNYQLEKGLITQDEADEQIKSYRSDVMSSASSLKKYRDTILSYIKDGIEKEIDAMSELIDKRKEALQRQKEADNYAKTVRDKTREINKLQMQIASMSGDTSNATLAKIKQLNAQLQEAQEDLDETRKDHSYDMLIQGLEDEEKAFEKAQKNRIKELESSLDAQNKAIKSSLQYTTSQYQTTADDIASIAKEYGIELEEAITEPWESGSNAFKTFVNATTALDTVEAKILDIKTSLDEYSNLHIQIDPTDLATVESEIAALQERLAAAIEGGFDDLAEKLQTKIDILQTKYDAQVDINTSIAQQAGTGELDNLPSFFERKNEIAQNNAQIIADAIAEAMPEEESEDTILIVGPDEDHDVPIAVEWDAIPDSDPIPVETVNKNSDPQPVVYSSYTVDPNGNVFGSTKTSDTNSDVTYLSYIVDSDGNVFGDTRTTGTENTIASTSTSASSLSQVAADNVAKTVAQAEAQLASHSKGDKLKTTKDGVTIWDSAVATGKKPKGTINKSGTKVTYDGKEKTAGGDTYLKIKYGDITGWVKKSSLKTARLGTKAAMRGLYLTDEEGIGSEAIITNKGALRQLNAGDMVFNAKQKEELWKLSKMDLSALDKIKPTSNQTSINNTYGSLLTVNGDVTRDALPELKEILKQAYEYTSKQMYMTQRKKGF